ncbi:MAG TPA: DUF4190 domain-containing protein [Saprospiraceae bacterium]|nr:DUF4190 domain-containing protein [Saprospiraceae bacterium]
MKWTLLFFLSYSLMLGTASPAMREILQKDYVISEKPSGTLSGSPLISYSPEKSVYASLDTPDTKRTDTLTTNKARSKKCDMSLPPQRMAKHSLGFALIGIVFIIVPFGVLFTGFMGLKAIIFGFRALKKIRQSSERCGRGLAIGGIILGTLLVLFFGALLGVLISLMITFPNGCC